VLALLLVTGTRLSLVLLIAPLATALSLRGSVSRRFLRLVVLVAVLVVLAVAATYILAGVTRAHQASVVERFSSIRTVIEQPGSDNSYSERASQSRSLWRAFRENPVWGTGLGYSFPWETATGEPLHGFNMDVGLAVPAKFGVVGVVIVLAMYGACFGFSRRLGRHPRGAVARGALNGYLTLLTVWFLFGSPFEDKGTSFGLLCLFALCLAALSDAERGARNAEQGEPSAERGPALGFSRGARNAEQHDAPDAGMVAAPDDSPRSAFRVPRSALE
jgi:O-antigen ligase